MDVTATTSDDVGVTAVRLVAKINNKWVEIGPLVTQPSQSNQYDWDVNLCAVGPLNGPLEVALRVWDHEGNVASALGPRTINVDHACPPPSSDLFPAAGFNSTVMRLSWDAVAAEGGLGSFELQWRLEPGSWAAANVFTFPSSQRETWLIGKLGESYAFRLRALDNNGQAEPWPPNDAPDITYAMPMTCSQDAFEMDNSPAQARQMTLGTWAQRNLCGPGDPDWFSVGFLNTSEYIIIAPSISGGAAVKLTVLSGDGGTTLARVQAGDIGQTARILFKPAAAGSYTVKVEPLVPDLVGTDAVYRIMAAEAKKIFLPQIGR
jgi:hypothetical protein